MNRILRGTVVAMMIAGATLFGSVPAARADEDSYLNAFGSNLPLEPETLIAYGHVICINLENGKSPDNLSVTKGMPKGPIDRFMIDAAQHELCPDTLP